MSVYPLNAEAFHNKIQKNIICNPNIKYNLPLNLKHSIHEIKWSIKSIIKHFKTLSAIGNIDIVSAKFVFKFGSMTRIIRFTDTMRRLDSADDATSLTIGRSSLISGMGQCQGCLAYLLAIVCGNGRFHWISHPLIRRQLTLC